MLESNKNLNPPLNERIPEKTLFLLLTPEVFKKNPKSRLYGNKFNDYKRNIDSIKSDLPHRDLMEIELESIQKRIGWISWEEIKRINPDCCKWL